MYGTAHHSPKLCHIVLGCTAQHSIVQVQLENLTTNHIYSVKVAAASESIYTPGQVLCEVFGVQCVMHSTQQYATHNLLEVLCAACRVYRETIVCCGISLLYCRVLKPTRGFQFLLVCWYVCCSVGLSVHLFVMFVSFHPDTFNQLWAAKIFE